MENNLYVEKYRPKTLDEMVLSDEYRKIFKSFIEKKEIPNLMFYGRPGGGKTSVAKILINNLISDKTNLLTLNGCASTGVDVQRNLVETFLQSMSFSGGLKIVFIDEADYLSPNAQAALKAITEDYTDVGRFIFTLNNPTKITEALHSRFQSFEFKEISKDFVIDHVKYVLNEEKVKFDKDIVERTVSTFYPDIRRIFSTLQSRVVDGVLLVENSDLVIIEKNIIDNIINLVELIGKGEKLKSSRIATEVQVILSKNTVDFIRIYKGLFDNSGIPPFLKMVVNEYANKHGNSMIPEMNFMAMIYSLIKIGNDYQNLVRRK